MPKRRAPAIPKTPPPQKIVTAETAVEDQPNPPVTPLARDPELLSDFILEAREHLGSVERQLLALEQDPASSEAIHAAFRGFHSIKGVAGFLELTHIQEVSHQVETVLDLARNSRLAITPAIIDLVLDTSDYLNRAIQQMESEVRTGVTSAQDDYGPLVDRIRLALTAEIAVEPSPVPAAAGAKQVPTAPAVIRTVKIDTAKLDFLVDMVGEMVIAQSLLGHNPALGATGNPSLQHGLSHLARITGQVQKTAMSMRMVPIDPLLQKMARLVRDLSRKSGKRVDLETGGEETELDRNIVEELADPLMHMIRNAVDHGIEPPEERRRAGKRTTAIIGIRACRQAGHIVIKVSDDGRGLDREKIVSKARQRGLIHSSGRLSDQEVFNLIFEPGFSTADRITDISGRGVGMDVVKKQIQKLRGRIEVQSEFGKGVTFLLKLPLTLAIIEGLVVGISGERFILPIFAVKEIHRPTAGMFSTMENRVEIALVRDRVMPLVRLDRRLGLSPRSGPSSAAKDALEGLLIVSEAAGRDFCFLVDEFIGKQEVVIKSLGEALNDIPGIAGGAILGDGRVGLIMDMEGIFFGNPHA